MNDCDDNLVCQHTTYRRNDYGSHLDHGIYNMWAKVETNNNKVAKRSIWVSYCVDGYVVMVVTIYVVMDDDNSGGKHQNSSGNVNILKSSHVKFCRLLISSGKRN